MNKTTWTTSWCDKSKKMATCHCLMCKYPLVPVVPDSAEADGASSSQTSDKEKVA
jgi:hypothetical protein